MGYKDPERQREYQRQYAAKRRAEFFADKTCVDCGATERLELDHRDAETKEGHAIWSWSKKRQEAEIAKCDIRCQSCHRERHRRLKIQHGTRSRYDKGCRCDLCKLASSNYRYSKRQEAA